MLGPRIKYENSPYFLPLIAFSSDINAQFGAQTKNIVGYAADAIIAGDADTLMAMRFNAYDTNG